FMEPKGHIVLDKYPGEWEAMPSYIEEPEAAACKWVSIRERNRERFDLPTVFSILIYTHPETGFPLAICDGSYHTVMRTGASAAVSAKWRARADREGRVDLARHTYRRGRRRQGRRPGARGEHPPARPDLRRRHPAVPDGRRDQRAAVAGAHLRERHRRRDRAGDHGKAAGA